MRGELEGLIREDGSVIIPADVAQDVLRALIRDLTTRVQRDGGEVSPQVRRVLHALHTASQRPPVSDVGSLPIASATVEVSVTEAARRMECSTRNVRHLLAAGRITGRRLSARLWLVNVASLDDYRRGTRAEDQDRRAG